MAEQFADAFKRYWAIIVTVATFMAVIGGAFYTVTNNLNASINNMSGDVRELRAVVNDNLKRLNDFAAAGPRYTLKDHFDYAEKQSSKDAEQDRRISVLEQKGK